MPFNIGPGELIIILVIALIVVGPGRLPDVGASLGKSIREFRKAATDVKESTSLEAPSTPAPGATPAAAAPAQLTTPAGPAVVAATPVGPAVEPVPVVVEPAPTPADASASEPASAATPDEQPTPTA